MACTIARLCIDCLDTGCVNIRPVDRIYEFSGIDCESFPNQLYIDPKECIDCGACEPEGPWRAIFQEDAIPEILEAGIDSNHTIRDCHSAFSVARYERRPFPTPEQVTANERKWSVDEPLTSRPDGSRV